MQSSKDLAVNDDENYIYLDKDGNAQKRMELTIHWTQIPLTKILLTCNSKYEKHSDSLSYIRYLIGETMERYSTFSGLSSLQANCISLNKNILPENGVISDHAKTGDHLAVDMTSTDLWLEVNVQAEETGIAIFLEIKVNKDSSISNLKSVLIDFVNQIFVARQISISFDEEQSVLSKLEIHTKENILTTDIKKTLTQSIEIIDSLELLNESLHIGECFNYVDRFVRLVMKRNQDYVKEKSLSMPSYTVSDSYLQITSVMPIRNVRIEPRLMFTVNKMGTFSTSFISLDSQKKCCCELF